MADAPLYYPPPAFYFEVSVAPSGVPWNATSIDGSFQEVSGMERELEFDELREGGENRFTYHLPKRGKHPNLVLKRGLVTQSSALANWAEATIGSYFSELIVPQTLLVTLLSAEEVLVQWAFAGCYPVKWVTSPFDAMENKIAVETLEMAYTTVQRRFAATKETSGTGAN